MLPGRGDGRSRAWHTGAGTVDHLQVPMFELEVPATVCHKFAESPARGRLGHASGVPATVTVRRRPWRPRPTVSDSDSGSDSDSELSNSETLIRPGRAESRSHYSQCHMARSGLTRPATLEFSEFYLKFKEMSDPHSNFHPNSLVPKWSSVGLPAVDNPPYIDPSSFAVVHAPSSDPPSITVDDVPLSDPPATTAGKNGFAHFLRGPPDSIGNNGSGQIHPVPSIEGSRNRVHVEPLIQSGWDNPHQRVDLQKSIDAVDAWPSIHNGW